MLISELIKELQAQMEIHGDIPVEIAASYDCGYADAGGAIEEIEYKEIPEDCWEARYHGRHKYLILGNYDG